VTDYKASLNSSLQQAASQVGMGDLYRAGLNEYRQAMRLKQTGQGLMSAIKSDIGKGIGLTGSGALGYWLYQKLSGEKAEGGRIIDRLPSRKSVLASLKSE
jgi:hypothetical protein